IGAYRTSPEVAEQMRRSMAPIEWTQLTGLPYQPVDALAPTKAQQEELLALQQQNQARADAELAERQKAEEAEGQDELQEEENFRATAQSPIEQAIENHFGEEVATAARLEVVERGELSDETAAKLQVDPSTFDLVVQHHIERADVVLDVVN